MTGPAARHPRHRIKRTRSITIELTDAELDHLKEGARADGMRLHDFARAALENMADAAIDDPMPPTFKVIPTVGGPGRPPREIAADAVLAAIREAGGSVRGAARILDVPQATLSGWLKARKCP